MAYTRIHYELAGGANRTDFGRRLGLSNLGLSIYRFRRGEGFDFFHNHREQEEVYFCIAGRADLVIGSPKSERLTLEAGDIVRVDPGMLRAIGNHSSEEALVIIAGACPHPYPAGFGHHDVIADVLTVVGHGQTGFSWPRDLPRQAPPLEEDEC